MEDFILPSPKKLAKKEDTRTVSLRVKEKTMTAFEKYAKQNDTTASALINGVLDSYIAYWQQKDSEQNSEEYQKRDRNAAKKVMSQYLEKLASRLGKFTDEELCATLFEESDDYIVKDDSENANAFAYRLKNKCWDTYISLFTNDVLNREFNAIEDEEAFIDNQEELFDRGPYIGIPSEKFPTVAYMLFNYVKKNKALYGERRTQLFSSETDEQIVDAINKTKVGSPEGRVQLAKRIAKILSEFEGAQDE